MPKFFFHLATPKLLIIDDEGVELTGLDAAQEVAAASARDIIADTEAEGYDISAYTFNVMDDQGKQVMVFEFKKLLNGDATT